MTAITVHSDLQKLLADPQFQPVCLLVATTFTAGMALAAYSADCACKGKHNKVTRDGAPSPHQCDDSQETSFAASSDCLRDIHEALQDSRLAATEGWAGGGACASQARTASFSALISRMADIDTETDAVIQTQAQQVKEGKSIIENTLNELVAAIPVAQHIYVSGPAGPAVSYQFQIAVSNGAMDTTINTTHETHQNAQKNAERLNEAAEKYREMHNFTMQ